MIESLLLNDIEVVITSGIAALVFFGFLGASK